MAVPRCAWRVPWRVRGRLALGHARRVNERHARGTPRLTRWERAAARSERAGFAAAARRLRMRRFLGLVAGTSAAETAKRVGKALGAWLLVWVGPFVLLVLASWLLVLIQLMLTHISSSTQPSCTLSPFPRQASSSSASAAPGWMNTFRSAGKPELGPVSTAAMSCLPSFGLTQRLTV